MAMELVYGVFSSKTSSLSCFCHLSFGDFTFGVCPRFVPHRLAKGPLRVPNQCCGEGFCVVSLALASEHVDGLSAWSSYRLAVVVPFRDRFDELLQFVPYMNKFLNNQRIPHKIYIINQIDKYRFNRASLINVGFLLSSNETDYIAMHDVDLLPVNPQLYYKYPQTGPYHVASPDLHPRYHYKTFVGGILLITIQHFRKVNGMSNKYWGWGMEDDEFYARIKRVGLNVTRPTNIDTGVENTFRHVHDRFRRKRDTVKLFNQRDANRKLDMMSGLSSIQYKIAKVHDLTIEAIPFKVIDVELYCNVTATPWCELDNGQKQVKPNAKKQG